MWMRYSISSRGSGSTTVEKLCVSLVHVVDFDQFLIAL